MPVYFGCESFTNDQDLIKCLNQNLNNDIQVQIAFFHNIADYLHIETAQSKLNFNINKEGDFSELTADGVNPIFNSVALSSLFLLQNKMDKANRHIVPGKDTDNNATDTNMNLSLRYESAEIDNQFDQFPASERVLFTIKTAEELIEVRMDNDYTIRTIGQNSDREYFLGRYTNLFELSSVEPYASAFEEAFKSRFIDVTSGDIDGKNYRIRIKNFFENDPEAQVLIIVIREENGTWAEYYEYKTKKAFNQSRFAPLTYR